MSSADDPSPQRFALRAGVRLHPLADGSGVLADAEPGEAHALNPEATRLLSSAQTWSEASLSAELQARGASADAAATQAARFLDGLRALEVLEPADG